MPIRTQALLLFNLVVILLTVIFAWRAAMVASQAVRQRIVQQAASNTAAFLATQNFPMGDHLLTQLNQMFDVQFVAIEKTTRKMLGTSLKDSPRQVIAKGFESLPDSGEVQLNGTHYLYHADKTLDVATGPKKQDTVLYVLVPESQLTQAATTAFWGVVRFGIFMLAIGSVVTWFLAERFTRPIRDLARAMDDPAQLPQRSAGTSDEIRLLYRSFAQLLERQEQSQQILVDSERLVAVGRMAAAVAHELRNPLSGIKMNLQVLRDELKNDASGENENDPSLELALQEVDRMELYLKEIMHLIVPVNSDHAPAVGSNAIANQSMTCQPDKAIRAALMLFAGRLRHAAIKIDLELTDNLPCVQLGESEYRQVLANLLINAIEATPEGGAIQILACVEGNYVKTSVSDSGSGVTLGKDKDPFQIFTSTKVDGTGLGLYICRRIIQGGMGNIDYENHTDKPGATFWFSLPKR